MRCFLAATSVVVLAILTSAGTVSGAITVSYNYVEVNVTLNVQKLDCENWTSEYRLAWSQCGNCSRPGWADEPVFDLTYTHLKIITGDNQCLLLNARIDPSVEGIRDLVMRIPIGVPLSETNISFGYGSDYSSVDIYCKTTGLTLERGSTYRIEITEQPRTCQTRQTAEGLKAAATLTMPTSTSCCVGTTGDIDGNGRLDVLDVNYLVAWMFRGGPPPPCMDEADVDGSGRVDTLDALYLVDYFWRGGPPPVDCP